MSLKNAPTFMGFVNRLEILKLWAIARENNIKKENNEFCVMPLKHVQIIVSILNRLRTPKPWKIAHETGH
jgi:hypothetical protein